MTGPGWVTVVPIKPLSLAKSRLRGAVPDRLHDRLVLAMAQDTVAAALACDRISRVIVVTDDPNAGTVLRASGARWVPDVPGAGLNAAFAYGARVGAGYASALGIAALAADLPAVRPADLAAALHAAGRAGRSGEPPAAPPRSTRGYVAPVQPRREPVAGGNRPVRAFVPDAAGLGTVLLTAPFGTDLDPRFGPGSAAAHAASGAVPIAGDWPGLRCDVDTAADLAAAARLGLGGFTAEVVSLARYGVDHDGSQRGPD